MTTTEQADLAQASIRQAARAGAEYLAQNGGLGIDDAVFSAAVKRAVREAIPGALRDAKDALDCGMGQIAETTYMASMALAGIEAAKSCLA